MTVAIGMTTDLWMLLYSVLLAFVLVLVPATEGILKLGMGPFLTNRDEMPDMTVWNKRACRTRDNSLENLALFAPLVLIAHVSGNAGDQTALGATIFFWSRAAHAIVYLAGIAYVRTLAWAGGVIGMALIAAALF